METWAKASLILCIYGFLKEFRPSESYITQYLVGPWKNFTNEEVNQQIYPVITYSTLAQLVVVFLVTDLLRYKIVIVFEGITGLISFVTLIVCKDMACMQAMSFFAGTFYATDVAYFTYIYAKVDRKYYQKVSSYTQTAFLLGRFSSNVVGQILVSTAMMDYHELNFLSGGAVFLCTVWALLLPPVEGSIYFHNSTGKTNDMSDLDYVSNEKDITKALPPSNHTTHVFHSESNQCQPTFLQKCIRAYGRLWKDFKAAYTNWYVVKWSLWWALGTCGFNQGFFYIQLLWNKVITDSGGSDEELQTMYNGAVEAIHTVIGAAAAFSCGYLRFNWDVLGDTTMAAFALLQGVAMIVAAISTNIWQAYVAYIVFGVLYRIMFTIVNAEVAKHINEDSYCLIFGVNTFFALLLQTILTLVVTGEGGFALSARSQYWVYGGYFFVLGAIFAVIAVVRCCGGKMRDQPLWLPEETSCPKVQTSSSDGREDVCLRS